MRNIPQTTRYWFNDEGPFEIALDGRKVHYRDANGENHTNVFDTSAGALSRYKGDLRSMRRNDCYTFGALSGSDADWPQTIADKLS